MLTLKPQATVKLRADRLWFGDAGLLSLSNYCFVKQAAGGYKFESLIWSKWIEIEASSSPSSPSSWYGKIREVEKTAYFVARSERMANKEANSNQNGIKEEGKMKHALSLGDCIINWALKRRLFIKISSQDNEKGWRVNLMQIKRLKWWVRKRKVSFLSLSLSCWLVNTLAVHSAFNLI